MIEMGANEQALQARGKKLPADARAQEIVAEARRRLAKKNGKTSQLQAMIDTVRREREVSDERELSRNGDAVPQMPSNLNAYIDRVLQMSGMIPAGGDQFPAAPSSPGTTTYPSQTNAVPTPRPDDGSIPPSRNYLHKGADDVVSAPAAQEQVSAPAQAPEGQAVVADDAAIMEEIQQQIEAAQAAQASAGSPIAVDTGPSLLEQLLSALMQRTDDGRPAQIRPGQYGAPMYPNRTRGGVSDVRPLPGLQSDG